MSKKKKSPKTKKGSKFPKYSQWKRFFKVLNKKEKTIFFVLTWFAVISGSALLLHFYTSNTEVIASYGGEFKEAVLVKGLNAVHVIVGHNYRFGRGKRGTTELLRRRGKKYGFKVNIVRNARMLNNVVSSSRLRSLLMRGRVCEASSLLGRSYHGSPLPLLSPAAIGGARAHVGASPGVARPSHAR